MAKKKTSFLSSVKLPEEKQIERDLVSAREWSKKHRVKKLAPGIARGATWGIQGKSMRQELH